MIYEYLIFSNEHDAYWKPNELGYTRDIRQAGTYTLERAKAICEGAGMLDSEKNVPNEIMIHTAVLKEWQRS